MPKFLVTCHATATIAEDWLVTADDADTAQEMVEDGGPDTDMILIDERTVGDETDREVVVQIAAFEDGAAILPADAEARVAALKALWRANPALSASLSLTDKLHAIAAARKFDGVAS